MGSTPRGRHRDHQECKASTRRRNCALTGRRARHLEALARTGGRHSCVRRGRYELGHLSQDLSPRGSIPGHAPTLTPPHFTPLGLESDVG